LVERPTKLNNEGPGATADATVSALEAAELEVVPPPSEVNAAQPENITLASKNSTIAILRISSLRRALAPSPEPEIRIGDSVAARYVPAL